MEIFTISGAPADGVEVLGDTPNQLFDRLRQRMTGPTGPTPRDQMCAQQVKTVFLAGIGTTVGSVGVGLFGTYKTLRSGNRALGVTSLIGAALLFGVSRVLLGNAAKRFQACRTAA